SCALCRFRLFFFFFQAEDGIRDWSVTGVQTCALPILQRKLCFLKFSGFPSRTYASVSRSTVLTCRGSSGSKASAASRSVWEAARSEERRVGKEGRSGWWRGH